MVFLWESPSAFTQIDRFGSGLKTGTGNYTTTCFQPTKEGLVSNRMNRQVLPNGGLTGSVVMDADNNVQSPQGEMTIGVTQTIDFDSEKIEADINAPMGSISMVLEDGEGEM
ncbi:MAG: hypothetical protein R6V27_16305, partial [Balneolaceae bacterium]